MNICHVCNKEIEPSKYSFTTGYGLDSNNNKICYACCADQDRDYMRQHGRKTLYLTKDDKGKYKVTNWPSSLEFTNVYVKKGVHKRTGVRYDCWFKFEGRIWHGVQYGDDTEIVYVKRTKRTTF